MINPTDKDIGRGVIYKSLDSKKYKGIIKSFNERFVFVRYTDQHPGSYGQATFRNFLFWENPDLVDEEC